MKIIEYFSIAWFSVGVIFKFLHWPGASFLIVAGLILLSFYYFLFSFAIFNNVRTKDILKAESYKNIQSKNIILALLLGMGLSLTLNGIMYQIQKWESELNILVVGLVSSLIVLLLYFLFLRKEKKHWKAVYLRSFLILCVGLAIFFVF